MVINPGYPSLSERVLSQSMHSYQGSIGMPQGLPSTYTSSLLGSNQPMAGQAMGGSYNGQPSYNLSSSYSSLTSHVRDGQYI